MPIHYDLRGEVVANLLAEIKELRVQIEVLRGDHNLLVTKLQELKSEVNFRQDRLQGLLDIVDSALYRSQDDHDLSIR